MKKEFKIIEQGEKLDEKKLIELKRYDVHSTIGITSKEIVRVLDKVVVELGGDRINTKYIVDEDIINSSGIYALYEPSSTIFYDGFLDIYSLNKDNIIITKNLLEEKIGGLFILKE